MDERRLTELSEAAEYATHRYELYKAKVYGPKPTDNARLAELKREAERAKLALHRAAASA